MVMTLWLFGLKLRLLQAHMYVFEISKFVHNTHIIIFNQVTEAEITVHKDLLNLSSHVHQFSAKEIFFHFLYSQKNKTHNEREPVWNMVFSGCFCPNCKAAYAISVQSTATWKPHTYYQPGISNFKVHKMIANNKKTLNVAFFAQTQFGHSYCILSENTPANMK